MPSHKFVVRVAAVLVLFPLDVDAWRDTDLLGEEHHPEPGEGHGNAGVHRAHAQLHGAAAAAACRPVRICCHESDRLIDIR